MISRRHPGFVWAIRSFVVVGLLTAGPVAAGSSRPAEAEISGQAVGSITANSAAVGWITNEPGDTQVQYGLTEDYSDSTEPDPTWTYVHDVTLSGLASGTTYHLRARSRDYYGNLSVSPDFTFTTPSSYGDLGRVGGDDTPIVIPPLKGPTGPSGVGVLFQSNWDTATGTSSDAVTDGGRWPNYWEFDRGTGVRLLSIVPGGPNGHNALRVQQRGSTFAANLQADNVLPTSSDYYLRFYMRNDDTSSSGDHIVTIDTFQYASLTFMRKVSTPTGWTFKTMLYGCGYEYPIGHWGPNVELAHGRWYRFEYFVHFVDAYHIQLHPRVYDEYDNLLYADNEFVQSDYKIGGTWNGRDDWTLASYYAAGYSLCVDPSFMSNFGLGNNGQYEAEDTGDYWYFAGVQIRTDTWPGALPPASHVPVAGEQPPMVADERRDIQR